MSSQELSTISNPFGGKEVGKAINNPLANAEAERAVQEVQAAMVIAKRFPRDQLAASDRIIQACCRETLAETALYSYPRGGQEVTGPSIRLAEALAQEWGNLQFGIRELSNDNGQSTVEAFAWDVERNTRQTKIFQVSHTRYTKRGMKQLTDPRDIYEMVANQGARRLRACILGIIPGDVTEAAVRQCEVTQASSVDVTPESIKKMVDAFKSSYNINQEQIEKRIGRRSEAINNPIMLNLRKIYQSLKDGMSKPADWFEFDEESNAKKPSSVSDMVKSKDDAGKKKAEPEPDEHSDAYALISKLINNAKTSKDIESIIAMPNWKDLVGDEAARLNVMANDQREAFQAAEALAGSK